MASFYSKSIYRYMFISALDFQDILLINLLIFINLQTGKSNIEWKQLWKIVHKCEKCIILKI